MHKHKGKMDYHNVASYEEHEKRAAQAEVQRDMASDGFMHMGLGLHQHSFGLFHSKKKEI